jgi:hypothetical protein
MPPVPPTPSVRDSSVYIGASALLTCVSLILFALAIKRHHRQAFGRIPARSRIWLLRTAATITLCMAPIPWIVRDGLGMSLVTWLFCALPLVGIVVVLLLAYLPQRPERGSGASTTSGS